ncbi:MAG: hypothetical protein BZY88_18095 [SAR202 cluster bacterium Io17-Chloro-G9]|nr:MAG: hypothetical protein BZY88_18095 [SAR202 cluster bacterium Io17-Chloro-G9]
MYAAEFEYQKASSVAEAVQMLGQSPGAKLLAGGHSLLPMLKMRLTTPPALIDIGGISELHGITVTDDTVRIGALTTHHEIATSQDVQNSCMVAAEAAEGIGDPQVRNRGTIGGNVVHCDPASDWPTVLTALKARFVIQGPRGLTHGATRTVDAGEFFKGLFETDLKENEVLTAIEIPRLGHHQLAEYAKMAHPASFYAVVGAAVVITVENDRCTAASIAVGGMVPNPVLATSVANALVGQQLNAESIQSATDHMAGDLSGNLLGDFYASADYRKAMAAVETKHALNHAIGLAHH